MPIIKDRRIASINEEENTDFLDYESLDESNVIDNDTGEGIKDMDALLEAFILDEFLHMNENDRQAYLESDEFIALTEAGVVNKRAKNAMVRLGKAADLERRKNVAAVQMAREKGDPLWKRFTEYRKKMKDLAEQIHNKYGKQVLQDVTKAQRRLIHLNPRAFKMMATDIR